MALMDCENNTTLDALSEWLQDEEDCVDTPEHTELSNHIKNCPVCSQRVDSLRKISTVTKELAEEDLHQQEEDTSWIDAMLGNLLLETRSGRSIPLAPEYENDELSVTEGAVIAAVRLAADALDDVLIGKCRLHGDVETLGAPVTVNATASVRAGLDQGEAVDELRKLIAVELALVSELNIEAINISVGDVFGSPKN